MMVDGGITEGVEEVGGEGGGLIIPDLLRKETKRRDETSTRRNETGSKLLYFTLPYLTLLLQRGIILFAKKSLYCEEKEPKQPFLVSLVTSY